MQPESTPPSSSQVQRARSSPFSMRTFTYIHTSRLIETQHTHHFDDTFNPPVGTHHRMYSILNHHTARIQYSSFRTTRRRQPHLHQVGTSVKAHLRHPRASNSSLARTRNSNSNSIPKSPPIMHRRSRIPVRSLLTRPGVRVCVCVSIMPYKARTRAMRLTTNHPRTHMRAITLQVYCMDDKLHSNSGQSTTK